jgi:hypothetical protein
MIAAGSGQFANHWNRFRDFQEISLAEESQLRIGPFRCIVAGPRLVGMLPIEWMR